ncbi:HAMP domain-containing protein [Oryzomonas japonica]|uniref:histidine kinase n=1 Tax=Oryzomonas japonica TaxID=2603858 RepID=A0A7J4ZRQ5_9BACT|nr:cache domain-containing protein [Oryzomonas japonica]KAB0665329.1 HAMP domain-containing protein [Oryzomonas japonica]
MKFLRTSIRFKLTVGTMVPLMAAIAVCWVIGSSIIITRFISEAQQTVESNLSSANEIFLGEMARLSDIIRLAGLSPELSAALRDNKNLPAVIPLQSILRNDRLSFLTLVDRYGLVRYRAANPGSTGDALRSEKILTDAAKGIVCSGIFLLRPEQVVRENPQLPSLMNIPLKPTPLARTYTKQVENRGLFLIAAAPVIAADGTVAGVIYGGMLLNGENRLVDRITRVIFQPRENAGQPVGSATVFLDDVRIATSVMNERGERAIGSVMSAEVYNAISRGEKWNGKAFVVDRWNFTAYEPLRDYRGTVVGALYVGMPEQPYAELRSQINMIFSGVLAFVTLFGVPLSAWLGSNMARPIKALEEGARRIAAGEQQSDITVDSHDEIASLAGEFNIMKRRLKEREREILSLNHTLEEKVTERTTQLEEKNEQLLLAQKELAQAERLAAIGLLASGVAHEINNPLAIIRGNVELLEMNSAADDHGPEELDTIMRQVARIERIVKNLRAFSRGSAKQLSRFSLAEVLEDILDQVGHQVLLDPYTVTRDYRGKEIMIEADEDQLRQVFTNLIVNGLQAMEGGGTLFVDIGDDPEAGLCRVAVADTGPGLSEEQVEKLFTPFYTTKPHGTGLGLAVSYGIVRDHGGEIEVLSEPGQGTIFSVILPLKQASEEQREQGSPIV